MKVLIVDDEAHVREGIDLSVDWEKFGVTDRYMAENGIQALESLKNYKPAVMFCDMKMPVMNGIELLQKIREEGLDTHVIVISGYDDFEYTRATIKANGIDYILKPFRRKDVEDALQKAVQAWKEQSETRQTDAEREYVVRKADEMLDEKKLASYFRGETQLSSSVRRIFEKYGMPGHALKIALILPKNRMRVLDQRFMMDDELFSFAFRNIAQYAIGHQTGHYICRLDDYQWLLLLQGGAYGPSEADYKFYLERLKRALQQTLKLEVLIGTGAGVSDLPRLPSVIGEARNALLNGDVLSDETHTPGITSAELPALMNQQFLLQKAIETGNKPFATDILSKHVNALRQKGKLQLKELQVCTMEANLLLGRWKQLAQDQRGDAQTPFLPLWINDLDEWEQMLIHQVHLVIDSMNPHASTGRGIEQIKDYLDKHFHEDTSLTWLAEHFHFSPQYISKRFKEVYHTTIVAYLTDLKMEKAKALLKGTALSIADIANQLGYEDENYFSKVFKKQVGLSPFPYRKEHEIK
ncbi:MULTISPECIES: response regulator transcription factor [unclassified Paenibacillus]|uniref:response regulator transcription factor n=1 Tax=unclassified Paenibacillus TaxID=185978 RepID=UPI0036387F93